MEQSLHSHEVHSGCTADSLLVYSLLKIFISLLQRIQVLAGSKRLSDILSQRNGTQTSSSRTYCPELQTKEVHHLKKKQSK